MNVCKQADLEYSDFRTESDGVMNTTITFMVKNNGDKTMDNPNAVVVCKKDGKAVGFVDQPIYKELKPGQEIAVQLDGSHEIPSDCDDYEIFMNYFDLTK